MRRAWAPYRGRTSVLAALAASGVLMTACGQTAEPPTVGRVLEAPDRDPADTGPVGETSPVQVATHTRTYRSERLPDGLVESGRDSSSIPDTIDAVLDPTAQPGSEGVASEPLAVSTIDDQRAALTAPDRRAGLHAAGYSREVVDVGEDRAELLVRGDEATLRWWDEKGAVHLRGHHLGVNELLHFAESVE